MEQQPTQSELNTARCVVCGQSVRTGRMHVCETVRIDSARFAELFWEEA